MSSEYKMTLSGLGPVATDEGLRVRAAERDMTAHREARKALELAEARYHDLYENAPVMFASVDPATAAIVDCNQTFANALGYAKEELIGRPMFDLYAEGCLGEAKSVLQSFLRNGEVQNAELRAKRKDGTAFDVVLNATSIRGRDGVILYSRSSWTDVSERKRAVESLALSEAKYRDLFESAYDLILLVDGAGHIIDINRRGETLTGYSRSELLGLSLVETIVVPEDRAIIQEVLQDLVQGKERIYEVRWRAKDGSILHFEGSTNSRLSASGELIWTRCILRDITERRRAEEALRTSEEKYRSFFQEDLAGNYVSTPDGGLLDCNPSFARIMGFDSVAAAMQSSLWSHYPSREGRESFLEMLRKHGRLRNHEHELRRRDGSRLRVIENAVGRFDEQGELVEVHGFLIDDTERRKTEEQLRQAQKIEAIGQLAGGLAHDFNNLLGVIIGYCGLLQRDIGHAHPGQARLEQIRKAADRSAGLTRQLLAFSRKQVLEPKVLDLNAVVTDVEKMLRRLIGEDIELVTVLAHDLGCAKVDPGQIEQVIINLAVNARDAMSRGGRLIIETDNADLDDSYARAHPGVRPGPQVMLAVSDTGHGMDAETLSHMFEPFFTTKEPGKGTGLGLATVYGIVKQSGGFIAVYSEPGRGSTFKIYLPRVEGAAATRAGHVGKEAVAGGSETVLLLEDEASLRQVIRELLEGAGYTVIECANPEEALSAGSGAGPIHLMLTDVVMPRMTGPEVAERLRALRPRMKVLYMSGYTDDAIAQHGVLEPGTEFITKPFTTDAVLRRVRKLLDRAEA